MSSNKALPPDVTEGKESPAVISEGTYVEHVTALFYFLSPSQAHLSRWPPG